MTAALSPALLDYLERLYQRPLLRRGDQRYPIIVFPPSDEQREDVDSVLGALPRHIQRRDNYAIYDYGHLHSVQNAGRHLYDGPTFVFKSLRLRPLRLTAEIGSYYDMLATCGALEREARAADGLIRLPSRTQLHRRYRPNETLLHGNGRSAAIGVATLIVCYRDGGYQALLAQRTARAATDPLAYHVMPTFMFQPSAADSVHPLEWSVRHQIYREYLEELFGMAESAQPQRPDYFYQHPSLRALQAYGARGAAQLYLTGVAINLLTLRPEICALLLIHAPEWAESSFLAVAEAHEGRLCYAPIVDDAALTAALPQGALASLPPQGAAALWLGVDYARAVLGLGGGDG